MRRMFQILALIPVMFLMTVTQASAQDELSEDETLFVAEEFDWGFVLNWREGWIFEYDVFFETSMCGQECVYEPMVILRHIPDFGGMAETGARHVVERAAFIYLGVEVITHCGQVVEARTVLGLTGPGRSGRVPRPTDTLNYFDQDGELLGYKMINQPPAPFISRHYMRSC